MNIYQHRFDTVEGYLHHRAPYLLVDEIISLDSKKVVTRKTVSNDDFFIQGHFPGAPIFPGAMMQELTTQTAGILIAAEHNPMEKYDTQDPFFNEFALGVLVRVKQARYRSFARPGETLSVTVTLDESIATMFDFSAEIQVDGRAIMSNKFQLTNIRSSVLQGK